MPEDTTPSVADLLRERLAGVGPQSRAAERPQSADPLTGARQPQAREGLTPARPRPRTSAQAPSAPAEAESPVAATPEEILGTALVDVGTDDHVVLRERPARQPRRNPPPPQPAPVYGDARIIEDASAGLGAPAARRRGGGSGLVVFAAIGVIVAAVLLAVAILAHGSSSDGLKTSDQVKLSNRDSVEILEDNVEVSSVFTNSGPGALRVDRITLDGGSVSQLAVTYGSADSEQQGRILVPDTSIFVPANESFTIIGSLRIDSATCAVTDRMPVTIEYTIADGHQRVTHLTLPAPSHTVNGVASARVLCARTPIS